MIHTTPALDHPPPAAGATAAGDDGAAREAMQARIVHLFRHALKTGSVNPLLYLVSHYRQAGRPCTR